MGSTSLWNEAYWAARHLLVDLTGLGPGGPGSTVVCLSKNGPSSLSNVQCIPLCDVDFIISK